METAILMAQEGASVLLTDVAAHQLDKALLISKEVVPLSEGKIEARVVDVTKEVDIENAVAHVDAWGDVDVMFNNAGIMHQKDEDAEECSEAIWDLTQNINFKGVWFGYKHAV